MFGILVFIYIMLAPRAEQLAQEAPATTTNISDLPSTAPETETTAEGFIFPESDRHLLTDADLEGLSKLQLSLARNEIFARKGRFFRTPYLKDYFSQYEWYRPNTWEVELNAIELANVTLIRSFEAR